jgi:hypothetical protein
MRRLVPALICLGVLYAFLALVALPRKAFFSSDEGLKFIQMQNALRMGWSDFALEYPGREVDPELNFVPINNPPPLIRDRQIYAVYPVVFPLLSAPLFSVLGYAGLYLIPLASGLLTLLLTARLSRLANLDGLATALVLGLCTPLLFYSLLFWDHTLGVLLSTAALLLVAANLRAPGSWQLLLGGLILGAAVWIRTELYVMSLVVPLAYFFLGGRRARQALVLGLGILASLLPLWLFQYFTYGSLIGPHLGHFASLGTALPVTTSRLAVIYYLLLESSTDARFVFLYLMAFAAAATVVASPRLRHVPSVVAGVFGALLVCSLPNLRQAWSGVPMGGLIATAPFLVLVLGMLFGSKATQLDRLLLAVCGGYIGLVCLTTPVDPGLQWGPRFLLPVFPLASVLALRGFGSVVQDMRSPNRRMVVGASLASAVLVSLFLQGCSIRLLHLIKNRDRQLIESASQLQSAWVISDEYGYAQYVAPVFYEKVFFYVRHQSEYEQLTEAMFSHGITTYSVATYATPHRREVDPFDVADGYAVRKVGDQLFQIRTSESTW